MSYPARAEGLVNRIVKKRKGKKRKEKRKKKQKKRSLLNDDQEERKNMKVRVTSKKKKKKKKEKRRKGIERKNQSKIWNTEWKRRTETRRLKNKSKPENLDGMNISGIVNCVVESSLKPQRNTTNTNDNSLI